MAIGSSIEWTEATWNPTVGCSKVSAGCKNCYAETLHARLTAMGTAAKYSEPFSSVRTQERNLGLPLTWCKPKLIFVNSMSDLSHEAVPVEFIRRCFEVMEACPRHRFQVLTKRSARLRELAPILPWAPNIWMGVSVEDSRVLHRVDDLRATPAAVKFIRGVLKNAIPTLS